MFNGIFSPEADAETGAAFVLATPPFTDSVAVPPDPVTFSVDKKPPELGLNAALGKSVLAVLFILPDELKVRGIFPVGIVTFRDRVNVYEKGPDPVTALTVLTYVPDGIVTPAGLDVRVNVEEFVTPDNAAELIVSVADVELLITTLDIVVPDENTPVALIVMPGTNGRISVVTDTDVEPLVVVIVVPDATSMPDVIADVNNAPIVNLAANRLFLLASMFIVEVEDCNTLL